MHVQEFVCLPEAVPRAIVFAVCIWEGVGGMGVFFLGGGGGEEEEEEGGERQPSIVVRLQATCQRHFGRADLPQARR